MAISLIGQMVGVRDPTDEEEVYKFFRVIDFDSHTREFEVLRDESGDDLDDQRRFKVSLSKIIRFPNINDPATALDFLDGTRVVGVYPHTRNLYKATIIFSIRKRNTDDYLLAFDGDSKDEDGALVQRKIAFHEVAACPEGYGELTFP